MGAAVILFHICNGDKDCKTWWLLTSCVVILVAYWSNNLHKQPNLSNIQCPRKIRRSRFKPENINGKKEKHRGDDVMIPTTNPATSGRESERTARICGESEEKKGERARVVMSRWNPWFSWSWAYLPNSIPPASRHPLFPSRISDSVPTWERTRTCPPASTSRCLALACMPPCKLQCNYYPASSIVAQIKSP
jgi:hypothetical protein